VAWTETRNIPTKPSPLLIGDRIYVMGDTGIATCFDAIEGTTIWTERVGGNYSASPLYVNGKIFFANHEGKVIVIEHADEYNEVIQNSIGEQIMASPIAVDDALFIRTDKHLFRFNSEQSNSKPAAVSQVESQK